jgi:hypothetical protein
MRLVEMTTSSNTGTLPPTNPVLPPCGHTANFSALQYLRIADTSSVVLGFNTIWLAPENGRMLSPVLKVNWTHTELYMIQFKSASCQQRLQAAGACSTNTSKDKENDWVTQKEQWANKMAYQQHAAALDTPEEGTQ